MTSHSDTHCDTIAAFIDGERIDPQLLTEALATSDGRDYLVELVAMRELVAAPAMTAPPATAATPRRHWSWLAAAAALLVVGIGSYSLGHYTVEKRIATERENTEIAPTATREVPPDASTTWIETTGGL